MNSSYKEKNIVVIILLVLGVALLLIGIGYSGFLKHCYSVHMSHHSEIQDCSETVEDFIDYCSKECVGDTILDSALVYDSGPQINLTIQGVSSISDANENIRIIREYIDRDNSIFVNNDSHINVIMIGGQEDDSVFYINYSFDTNDDYITDVFLTRESIPDTNGVNCGFEVQNVTIEFGEGITDLEVSVLEDIFPNAIIIHQ